MTLTCSSKSDTVVTCRHGMDIFNCAQCEYPYRAENTAVHFDVARACSTLRLGRPGLSFFVYVNADLLGTIWTTASGSYEVKLHDDIRLIGHIVATASTVFDAFEAARRLWAPDAVPV